ncbi:RHS repeat-associated core domain-containing protein [Facilibium subflavum]|uniref:RHS repeat-associated core domain-containing protein n=1 Tax=Facilibium subflavum TaxID=2219058 RepID=UPI000E654DD2|nr:RHS repeat-associated core domain-containing protein [Facilibium subflavum]
MNKNITQQSSKHNENTLPTTTDQGKQTTTVHYLINDSKSTIAQTDAKGNIIQSYQYDPYGNLLDKATNTMATTDANKEVKAQTAQRNQGNNNKQASTLIADINNSKGNLNDSYSITNNPFQYNGEYLDQESGLIYLRARYYSPQMQAFINRDSKIDEYNKYAFTSGNPIMNTDPSGNVKGNIKINMLKTFDNGENIGMNEIQVNNIKYKLSGRIDNSGFFTGELTHINDNVIESYNLYGSKDQMLKIHYYLHYKKNDTKYKPLRQWGTFEGKIGKFIKLKDGISAGGSYYMGIYKSGKLAKTLSYIPLITPIQIDKKLYSKLHPATEANFDATYPLEMQIDAKFILDINSAKRIDIAPDSMEIYKYDPYKKLSDQQ